MYRGAHLQALATYRGVVATVSPVLALLMLFAPPLSAFLGWCAVSSSSWGDLQSQFTNQGRGQEQVGDLTAGAQPKSCASSASTEHRVAGPSSEVAGQQPCGAVCQAISSDAPPLRRTTARRWGRWRSATSRRRTSCARAPSSVLRRFRARQPGGGVDGDPTQAARQVLLDEPDVGIDLRLPGLEGSRDTLSLRSVLCHPHLM